MSGVCYLLLLFKFMNIELFRFPLFKSKWWGERFVVTQALFFILIKMYLLFCKLSISTWPCIILLNNKRVITASIALGFQIFFWTFGTYLTWLISYFMSWMMMPICNDKGEGQHLWFGLRCWLNLDLPLCTSCPRIQNYVFIFLILITLFLVLILKALPFEFSCKSISNSLLKFEQLRFEFSFVVLFDSFPISMYGFIANSNTCLDS